MLLHLEFRLEVLHAILTKLFGISKSGSNSSSNFGSKFFIGNNLNSLRNFSLAVKDNPMLLSNQFFWIHFIPLSILFNSLSKFFCSLSAYSNHKIGKGYSMKL